LVACVCALVLSASSASAVILDDFSNPFTFTGGNSKLEVDYVTTGTDKDIHPLVDTDTQSGLSGVLGGSRNTKLTCTAGSTTDPNKTAEAYIIGGELIYSNDTGVSSDLLLEYVGLDDDDLTVGSAFLLRVEFTAADLAGSAVNWKVMTGQDGGGETAADATVTRYTSTGAHALLFPFAAFIAQDANIDFTDVDYTSVEIQSVTDGDYVLEIVESAVPEPLTMLGMFLGLGSIGAYIRRRRMF
jgi:hypothetical protein